MRDVDYKEDYLGDRKEGIGLDAKKLEETFKAFGYDILSFKNLRAAQIQNFGLPLLDEEPSSSLPLPMNKAPYSVEERLPPVYDFIRLVSTIEEYQSQSSINTTLCINEL